MTRFLYAALWALAAPLAVLRLAWRARRQPGYLARLGERFGRYSPAPAAPRIWIHAVSVGETRAAAPLIDVLERRFPGHRILLTHMTPTGRATGEALFGDRVERAWLPYDMGFATRAFLAHFQPRLGIVMETELWPRLLEEARRAGVPVLLANARLSERSARRYARVPTIARWALSSLEGIAAQTRQDAERFTALGAHAVEVTGNVKFDLAIPAESTVRAARLRALFGAARPVWVAGSTREGEEALLIEALEELEPRTLLVIVPRHPQRFEEVAALARARGLAVALRSEERPVPSTTRIVVGDTMGEMLDYYGAADGVLMGGSFLAFGSQNLIEPCALGRPVIVGLHTFNFEEAADGAIAAGAALRVSDARAAMRLASELALDPARRAAMGRAGLDFVAAHRGAVERLAGWIEARVRA